MANDFDILFYKWFLRELLSRLKARESARVDEETPVEINPQGQLTKGPRGLTYTPRNANSVLRSTKKVPIFRSGGETWALGDSVQNQHTNQRRLMFRGAGAPVLPMPFMPNAFHAPAELLIEEFIVSDNVEMRLPSWIAYQQLPGVRVMNDELWAEGFYGLLGAGGGGGGAS